MTTDPGGLPVDRSALKLTWRYARKKPVTIQFREVESKDTDSCASTEIISEPHKGEWVQTREGRLWANAGTDYIIRGVKGEFYPIAKEIFAQTYEVIEPKAEKDLLLCDIGKYLIAEMVERKPKTCVWNICSKSTSFKLGTVAWYSPWRQYCFFVERAEDIFNATCLQDITAFLEVVNRKQREKT